MRQYPVAYGNRTAKAQRKHRRNSGSIFVAPRYLVWVNLSRKFSVSRCLCGETLCIDPTTEKQRNRGHIL